MPLSRSLGEGKERQGPALVPDPGSSLPRRKAWPRASGKGLGLPVGAASGTPASCLHALSCNAVGQCFSWVSSCLQVSEGKDEFLLPGGLLNLES